MSVSGIRFYDGRNLSLVRNVAGVGVGVAFRLSSWQLAKSCLVRTKIDNAAAVLGSGCQGDKYPRTLVPVDRHPPKQRHSASVAQPFVFVGFAAEGQWLA